MSTPDPLSALGGLGTSAATSALSTAQEPANIRDGGSKAQSAYQTGLAFEQVLVNQLSQQLTASAGIGGTDSGDGSSDDSSDGSGGGLLGSGPAASEVADLMPSVLTSSLMGGGSLNGLADTLAASIDPAINDPASATSGSPTVAAPATDPSAGAPGTTP